MPVNQYRIETGYGIGAGASSTIVPIMGSIEYPPKPMGFDTNGAPEINVSFFGNIGASTGAYRSGVYVPEKGVIYCLPFSITLSSTLKIDPVAQTATAFGGVTGNSYFGALRAPNGAIYGIPSGTNTTQVAKFDVNSETYSYFGSLGNVSGKWEGGVLAPTGIIYGIPSTATTVLKIDTNTDTVSTFGSSTSPATLKWAGGVLAPNGKI